jgi:hypothetical protein
MTVNPPDTREHHVRMARIFLHQARETIHQEWRATLQQWAAERRLRAGQLTPTITQQQDLFQ